MRQPNTLKTFLSILFLGLCLGLTQVAQAKASESPEILLKNTATKMIDALNQNRDKIKGNPLMTEKLIEKILLPHIDIITASKYVLGPTWNSASTPQKIEFIKTFRNLLLRFYSSALSEYLNSHDEKLSMSLISFQDPGKIEGNQVTIRSTVQPKNGKPVPIIYQMLKTQRGWKVFDVSVEGVSVITTYKTSFASEIQQKGLDGLIASLKERNAKLMAGDNSALKLNKKQ
ncbi:MAG: ABC transporter substrate-binding protein [Gammaproteobacteria bacterium]